ncbi:MAG TPA: hypothetical protein VM597_02090 [Gemmataceae bacterium]|jgi:hypothetical protein|nr:hypothetical protein [Gemmataceae bacterium]
MRYLTLLAVGFLLAQPIQAQAPEPKIELKATAGNGQITVSGSVDVPAGWRLSIHTLNVKYRKESGGATLNWLIPVKGGKFEASIGMNSGSYAVWGVIDVKDREGREKQISSPPQSAKVP